MIYSDVLQSSKDEFETLLAKTKALTLSEINLKQINNGNKFEKFVFDILTKCAEGSAFEENIYQTADREFPDIVLKEYWGIEVKFTKDDKWTSIGNSILESSRIPNIEKIYLFFGKCGGIPDIKYRRYEECLNGVSVTYYPRYTIDMYTEKGKSIFEQMNIPYDELRKSPQPAKLVRKFYKTNLKENSSLWWIDDNDSVSNDIEIKFFSDLEPKIRRKLISEGFVLFPEVLNSKFARLCAFWISFYSIICPNMRDQYSAGGRVKININEPKIIKNESLRKIDYKLLFEYHIYIISALNELDLKLISECWDQEIKNRAEMRKEWLNKIKPYLSSISFLIPLNDYFQI